VDAVHAAEVGLSGAEDRVIIEWCRANGAMAVTLDADFHAQIALTGLKSPSSVRIRIEGLKGPDVARLLKEIFETSADELAAGALLTVQRSRFRLRRLPISRKPR
jgi:predicted nuclease of predicted toxin-antitoxin system